MSTNPRSTVVGVFRDRTMAEQALDALKNAGFNSEQIRYSGGGTGGSSGGFFGDLKSLFTGQETTGGNFVNDLADMGLADDETRYYADEYKKGNSVVAVNAPGRGQEVMNILQKNGAYNNPSMMGTTPPAPPPSRPSVQPSPTYAQQANSAPANANRMRQSPEVQPQAQVMQDRMAQENQQAVHAANTTGQPVAQPQPAQAQVTQQSQQMPGTADTVNRDTQLQTMQAQLQTVQRQIQEAQAQLQAAKQREADIQATRQREEQFHTTQKQLQEAQAQLQATLAELRATQDRVNQSNQ